MSRRPELTIAKFLHSLECECDDPDMDDVETAKELLVELEFAGFVVQDRPVDPVEVAADAIRGVWSVPRVPDRFPSTIDTARAAIEAVEEAGFELVRMEDGR